ncbi:MAG: YjfK family protein [Oceanospirillaceae bacterium]|nr:YjfK family protein [Oceanospirillaceae bacterium]
MFKKWFGKKEVPEVKDLAPEIMGLRIGGAFELDSLKLRLIEPDLIIEGAAATHLIQAVGVVKLDDTTTVLRYYTDDDGFIQVLLEGGMSENHISDVKLWYYYDTKSIASDQQWDQVLSSGISQGEIELEGNNYSAVWENATDQISAPVAMTEKTYAQDGSTAQTDQFSMLYEREIKEGFFEYVMFSGEEKIIDNRADRCLVKATGFDLQPADIDIIG